MSTPPFPGLPELSRKEGCPCGRLFVTEWGLKGKSVTLDFKAPFGILNLPNHYRRNRRLCHAPHGKKSGLFVSCHQCARGRVLVTYWQGDVRVSARPRRL